MAWGDRKTKRRERQAAERAAQRWGAPRTAFVLAGGGVLGAAQAGQLRALIESGITPDAVVGTSVGAINGAMVAYSPTADAVARLADIWTELKTEDIFPGSRVARVWNIVARGDHIHSNEGIRRLLDKLPARAFTDLSMPFHVCATSLDDGSEAWFSDGPLGRAILASTAIPAVYPPVSIDGRLYVDGGVVNNVPISKAVELGAQRIYVLTCGVPATRHRPFKRPIDVLIQSFSHARAVRTELDLQRFRDKAEIIMLPAFDAGFIRYNDPSHGASLIKRAYESTRAFLAEPGQAEA